MLKKAFLYTFLLSMVLSPLRAQDPGLWTFFPSGAIKVPPVVTPGGQIVLISEDQKVTVLDGFGKKLDRWDLNQRLAPFLSADLSGNLRLVTADRILHEVSIEGDVVWSFPLDDLPAGPGVVDWFGRTYILTRKGTLVKVSSDGQLIWSRKLSGAGTCGLILDLNGNLYADAGPGGLITHDLDGRLLWERQWTDQLAVMALHPGGTLWIQDRNGLLRIIHPFGEVVGRTEYDPFHSLYFSQEGGFWAVTLSHKVLRGNSRALGRAMVTLPELPTGQGALSATGALYLPLEKRILRVDLRGRVEDYAEIRGLGASLTLTKDGTLLSGDDQWTLLAFRAEPLHPFSWSQAQGNPAHNPLGNREGDWEALRRPWRENPDYLYFSALLDNNRRADREKILDEMEEMNGQGNLWGKWPFASALALQIAREGLRNPAFEDGRIANNWPILRSRAYGLLGQMRDPAVRKLLLEVAEKEFELSGVYQAVHSLGEIGYDFDGYTLEGFLRLLTKYPGDLQLAQAIFTASLKIKAYNQELMDTNAYSSIILHLVKGDYPSDFRRKVLASAQS
jgi:outer membrane protein assembly factor BamB